MYVVTVCVCIRSNSEYDLSTKIPMQRWYTLTTKKFRSTPKPSKGNICSADHSTTLSENHVRAQHQRKQGEQLTNGTRLSAKKNSQAEVHNMNRLDCDTTMTRQRIKKCFVHPRHCKLATHCKCEGNE